jgi:TM2 domain-containing membrane protein YozV
MAQPNALVPAEKDTALAYVLWFGGFFGFCGLHRIYMGRYASGLLWLFTGGLCFVGQFIDVVMMPRMIDDTNRGAGW